MTVKNAIVIYLENFELSTALGQTYLKSLWDTYGKATSYFGVDYPSAPNYLAFAGGSPEQIGSDACNLGKYTTENLGDLIEKAGKTWIAYAEAAPSNCPASDSGDYICHHFPWTYYADIWNNKTRCDSHCVAIANLVNDFPFSKTPENFIWITPNRNNDGHNTSPSYASNWLSEFIPKLMAQSWYLDGSTVIFIVTDTGNPLHNGYTASDGTVISGGQVFCVAISPSSLGASYGENACHYNLLSSVMDILGLSGTLGKGGTSAFPAMKSLYSGTAPTPSPFYC
jgi:hypothetical protein